MKKNLMIVAGETGIDSYLLLENDTFRDMLINGASIDELVTFVNNNY